MTGFFADQRWNTQARKRASFLLFPKRPEPFGGAVGLGRRSQRGVLGASSKPLARLFSQGSPTRMSLENLLSETQQSPDEIPLSLACPSLSGALLRAPVLVWSVCHQAAENEFFFLFPKTIAESLSSCPFPCHPSPPLAGR